MVIIESYKSGIFEAHDLKQAKQLIVETIAPTSFDKIEIDSVDYNGTMLADNLLRDIERDIEMRLKKWRELSKIESEGLRRAQQESMEG
jgi:hypothetical protein